MTDSDITEKHTSSPSFSRDTRKEGKGTAFRRFYYEYRSVIWFGLALSTLVVLSYWLSTYIPVNFFEQEMLPMMHAALLIVTVWGSAALFKHNDGIRARKIMAWVFLFWALVELWIIIVTFATEDPVFIPGNQRMKAQSMLVANLCAWLLLIYPTEALRPGWLTLWRAFLLLLPVIVLAILYYTISVDLRILMALYPVFIFFMVLRNIEAYRRWCEENFSSLEEIDVQWIWQYLVFILIVGASYYYLCVTTHPTRGFTQLWLLVFLVIHTTDNVLFRHDLWRMVQESDLAHQIVTQATGYETDAEERARVEQPQEEPQPSAYAEYKQLLDAYMTKEKPFLNKDLRLTDLMKVIPLNRSYLSQLINSEYGCNFYQFVTSYRIAEAMRLMTKYPDMKLQEIADRSGFSSPAVFSRTFVREIGVTPTDWLATNSHPLTRNP